MGRMIEQPCGGDAAMTNFQFASSTLDAGVKIYAYRVDSVYNETYKLIGGLNRAKGGSAGEDAETGDDAPAGGDGDDGETSGVAAKEVKRARRVKPPSTNLEANPASLDLKKLELAFAVDPLFHQTSAKFDEGGAKGLLLINLPVRPGNILSFDSSEARGAAVAKAAPQARIPLATLSALLPRDLDEMHVCADLAGMVRSTGSHIHSIPAHALRRAKAHVH
jgi:condensin complex subunit 2